MSTIINGDGIITVDGAASTQGRIRLAEQTGNGTNTVTIQAAASMAADLTFTMPSADGTNGQFLQTNGSGTLAFATPAAGAMILLADTAPTAAANVDFLNTFTADYDTYFITLQSIMPASSGRTLNMRVAVGGSAQSSANTYRSATPSIANLTFNATSANLLMGSGTLDSTGNGFTGYIRLHNANGSGWKTGEIFALYQTPSDTTILSYAGMWVYSGSSALSGVTFFLDNGGGNFAAQGRIRVYGIKNT
jgi:hypothetical protein